MAPSKAPLPYPAIEALRWIVVLVDLDVDEPDVRRRESLPHCIDDIHHWPARPTRAELRCRKDNDERLVYGDALGDGVA